MPFLGENLSIAGLDISDKSLKIAQVIPGRRTDLMYSWGSISVPDGVIENGEIVEQDKLLDIFNKMIDTKVYGKISSKFISASLPETKTFLKVLDLSILNTDETKELSDDEKINFSLEKELPKEFPFPIDDIMYDYKIISHKKSSVNVLVGAIEKNIVYNYIEFLERTGFVPVNLEIEAQSLVRFLIPENETVSINNNFSFSSKNKFKFLSNINIDFLTKKKSKKTIPESIKVIVDLGENRTGVIIFHEGVIKFTRSLEYSGIELTQKIADFMKLDFNKAEKAKILCGLDPKKCKGKVRKAIIGTIKDIAKDIQDTVDYYVSIAGIDDVGKKNISIILTGGGSGMINIDKELEKELRHQTKIGKISRKISFKDKKKEFNIKQYNSYSTAIGLSLKRLYD